MHTTIVAPLVLREHLEDPAWVVVDCRHALADFGLGRRQYDESHVPGAFFASVEDDLAGHKTGKNGRHPLPDARRFAAFLAGIGVRDGTQLVAYDAGADMFAARFWFLSRWIGHDAVAVLDGGFNAWKSLGYPVTAQVPAPRAAGNVEPRTRHDMLVDARFVHDNLSGGEMHLLDARAEDRFAGQNETVDPIAGHIPGARNRWFKKNFNDDGSWKSREQLRAEFSAGGADHERVVHQCGSGVSAAVNQLAMVHAGIEGSRVYGGSWSEWIADPSRPIATGAPEED